MPSVQKLVRYHWGWEDKNTSINAWFADGIFVVSPKPGDIRDYKYQVTLISSISHP